VDSSAGGLLEGMGLDGDTLAPMETDEPTAADPKAKSKLTPAMATRIKQIKPLLSGKEFAFSSTMARFHTHGWLGLTLFDMGVNPVWLGFASLFQQSSLLEVV